MLSKSRVMTTSFLFPFPRSKPSYHPRPNLFPHTNSSILTMTLTPTRPLRRLSCLHNSGRGATPTYGSSIHHSSGYDCQSHSPGWLPHGTDMPHTMVHTMARSFCSSKRWSPHKETILSQSRSKEIFWARWQSRYERAHATQYNELIQPLGCPHPDAQTEMQCSRIFNVQCSSWKNNLAKSTPGHVWTGAFSINNKPAALTVISEALFVQGTIFAHEQHDIATCNTPWAFLQADNPDYVLMRLDGILAYLW